MSRLTPIPRRQNTLHRPNAGFSLIEVMMTVVVISVGLLGLASLQMQSKQSNLIASQRSVASHMVHGLLERMRSNLDALAVYVPSDSARTIDSAPQTSPAVLCTSNATCDASQLAAYDLWEWSRALNGAEALIGNDSTASLLDPVACLGRPAGGGSGVYTIAIAWRAIKAVDNPVISANSVANGCGAASGNFDQDVTGDNRLRHVYWINSFIDAG